MRRRRAAAALAAGAMLMASVGPAATAVAAKRLPVPAAAERSSAFAERTCDHDRSCVRSGVLNCNRQAPRVVLCRIFDERRTTVQGRYRCHRLIRVSLVPGRGMPVTGIGRWHC